MAAVHSRRGNEESTAHALNFKPGTATPCNLRVSSRSVRNAIPFLILFACDNARGSYSSISVEVESIANSQGLFSIAIEDEAALLHHSNRSRERREGVGDDARDFGAGVKVVDECACTFGGVLHEYTVRLC